MNYSTTWTPVIAEWVDTGSPLDTRVLSRAVKSDKEEQALDNAKRRDAYIACDGEMAISLSI